MIPQVINKEYSFKRLVLLIIFGLSLHFTNGSYAFDEELVREQAEKLFKEIYDNRLKLKTAKLDWTVVIKEWKDHPEQVGAISNYTGWYEYHDNRFRVELEQESTTNPELNSENRFAFDKDRYLLFSGDDTVGKEYDGYDVQFMKSKDSSMIYSLSTDPRLVGILPSGFYGLLSNSLEDLLEILDKASKIKITEEDLDQRKVIKLVIWQDTGTDYRVTYWLAPDLGNMPIKIETHAERNGIVMKNEFRTQWKDYESHTEANGRVWLPLEMEAKKWKNDELIKVEVFKLVDARLGERADDRLFTWDGMNIKNKFVVDFISKNSKFTKQWNNTKNEFETWQPVFLNDVVKKSLPERKNVPQPQNFTMLILIIFNGIVGLVLIFWAVKKFVFK